jgi:ethanolamine utilization protein EutA
LTRIEGPAHRIAEAAGIELELGSALSTDDRPRLVNKMAEAIFEIVQTGPQSELAQALMLTDPLPRTVEPELITFSGGVSEYIFKRESKTHGDMGQLLAQCIVQALGQDRLPWPVIDPGQGIRATVIGASQFSVQVSGNTILVSDPGILPIRNVPVAHLEQDLGGEFDATSVSHAVKNALKRMDVEEGQDNIALAFKWAGDPLHARLFALAKGICDGLAQTTANRRTLIMVMEGDIARALGQILRNELNVAGAIVSIDGVQLAKFDYIDIGEIIEPSNVVPLIIKSLLFSTPD